VEAIMVIASDLKSGMALRIERQIFKVIEVEVRAGAAKMGGTVRTRLSNVQSGRIWEHCFRPLEHIETVQLEKRSVEFLFSDGESCIFQRLDTFEQIEIRCANLGLASEFLQPGAEFPAEFFDNELVGMELPGTMDARVKSTAPPARTQQDSGRKEAILENGITIQVPLFVAAGEWVSVELKTGRYVERVRTQHRKSA
jgi:elongation factor P